MPFEVDLNLRPIQTIAQDAGFHPDDIEPYGKSKAKVRLDALGRASGRPEGHLIGVSAITPTVFGEGKTVTTIGLGDGLRHIGKRSMVCLRQPSLGPVFGMKGGAAGGGHATVEPAVDINLHFTGDLHAIAAAHNLLLAAVDAHLFHGNPFKLDPARISLRRAIDISDRALRDIAINSGSNKRPIPRNTGFDITAASEVMALFALARGTEDLKNRLGRILVGFDDADHPITASMLKVAGSMAVLLKDAIHPNLAQTSEGTPALIHAGPFANIAHGNSSIVADDIALRHADYVVTESGFGSDLGMEKFFDIKCRAAGRMPHAIVVVATVRALKMHGGAGPVVAGQALPSSMTNENLPAVRAGCANLRRHLKNVRTFGVPAVVAVNRFPGDTDAEVALVIEQALEAGAFAAHPSEVFQKGGAGAAALASAVVAACEAPREPRLLYADDLPLVDKVHAIATTIYGAADVAWSDRAKEQVAAYTHHGWGSLPICMAKTQYSLSHDPKLQNAPEGFTLPIRELRPSLGAGFILALCGDIMTMPGLPAHGAYEGIDLIDGRVVGL